MNEKTDSLQCPRCGALNPREYKFCGQCGAPLRESSIALGTDSTDRNTAGEPCEALGAERQEIVQMLSTSQENRAGATNTDGGLGGCWDIFIAGLAAVVFFPFGWFLPAWILVVIADANPELTFIAGIGAMLVCLNPIVGVVLSGLVFRSLTSLLSRGIMTRGGALLGTVGFILGVWVGYRWIGGSTKIFIPSL